MLLCGGNLGIHVPDGEHLPEDAALVYRPEGCPPGYCRLEVCDVERVLSGITNLKDMKGRSNPLVSQSDAELCIVSTDGKLWLSTNQLLRAMQKHSERIQGPAGQHHDGQIEWVPALVCSSPHPSMQDFLNRHRRGWPMRAKLHSLLRLPMLLVLVGHKHSPTDLQNQECRVSWSHHEMEIVCDIPDWIRQGFIMCKYTLKSQLKRLRGTVSETSGRSVIGSYHLKTILFHMLEQNAPGETKNPFDVMLELLNMLKQHLVVAGQIPHYFMPHCNLLETVNHRERFLTISAIQGITDDPLAAVLQSPSDPQRLYGALTAEVLEEAFYKFSVQSDSEERRRNLQALIRQLYDHRESWWRHQIETFSALLALCEENAPVTGGFPLLRSVTRSFDVFIDLRLNKHLSKQARRRWFDRPSCSLLVECRQARTWSHFYWYSLSKIGTWISNYITSFIWFVISHLYPDLRGG